MAASPPVEAISLVDARGFSLLELMVALAILAIVATSVYSRGGDAAVQLHGLEQRTLGHWVMLNQLTKIRLEQRGEDSPIRLGSFRERKILGDRVWEVVVFCGYFRYRRCVVGFLWLLQRYMVW